MIGGQGNSSKLKVLGHRKATIVLGWPTMVNLMEGPGQELHAGWADICIT